MKEENDISMSYPETATKAKIEMKAKLSEKYMKAKLSEKYMITNLSLACQFLGIKIHCEDTGISLATKAYITTILR